MKYKDLQTIIKRYDNFIEHIDFSQLPAADTEEYRLLVLKTANDAVFSEGRYSNVTEFTLEMFDEININGIDAEAASCAELTEAERIRLRFYLDLAKVCYPLFSGKQVDWTAWPWQMKQASSSMDNEELFNWIAEAEWPNLAAAVLYDLKQLIMADDRVYSSVAQQEVAEQFEYEVKRTWEAINKEADQPKILAAAVNECVNKFWFVENHIQVGRLLGFDWLAQSVYDAFDTYIDKTYRHKQVTFAIELADWIRHNLTIGEASPEPERIKELNAKMHELMDKYSVSSPDLSYTWNILLYDVLGTSLFADEEEDSADYQWNKPVNK